MTNYTGDDRILYIKYNGSYVPVGCLSDNSMSESVEFIGTKTRGVAGTWKTQRPVSQTGSISFSGFQKNTTQIGGDAGLISYDRLKRMKRSFELVEWEIRSSDLVLVDRGKGHIDSLGESAPAGDWLTFDGSITIFGAPSIIDLPANVIYYGPSSSIPTTLAGLQSLTTVEYTSPITLNTGTTDRFFIIGIQTQAGISSVSDLDSQVGVGSDITTQYILRSVVSGYEIYAMEVALNYSTNHRHLITLL